MLEKNMLAKNEAYYLEFPERKLKIIARVEDDAKAIVDILKETVEKYGFVTVADLFSLLGIETTWIDNEYGWTNLDKAGYSLSGDGFQLNLPNVEELKT